VGIEISIRNSMEVYIKQRNTPISYLATLSYLALRAIPTLPLLAIICPFLNSKCSEEAEKYRKINERKF
jgi:hypothetical protein